VWSRAILMQTNKQGVAAVHQGSKVKTTKHTGVKPHFPLSLCIQLSRRLALCCHNSGSGQRQLPLRTIAPKMLQTEQQPPQQQGSSVRSRQRCAMVPASIKPAYPICM